jgi:hypothetical protein
VTLRPRLDLRVMLRLAFCIAALLLLARCGSPTPPSVPTLPSPTPVSEEAEDADAAFVPATPEVSEDAGWARELLQQAADQGNVLLLVVLVALVVVLLVLLIVLLVRAGSRRRAARREAPGALKPEPTPLSAQGDTLELSPGVPAARLVLPAPEDAGEGAAWVVPLTTEGLTIGRGPDNDLVIDVATPGSESVSRQHARIFCEGGRWILEDLESQNGVYVNGRRTGRNVLQDGWTLAIGGVQAVFYVGDGEVTS